MADQLPPPGARAQFLALLERSYERLLANPVQTDAAARQIESLGNLIAQLKNADRSDTPAPAEPVVPLPAPSWREFEAIFSFYEEAIAALQAVRHAVREGRAVDEEPPYPSDRKTLLGYIQRTIEALKGPE